MPEPTSRHLSELVEQLRVKPGAKVSLVRVHPELLVRERPQAGASP